MDGSALETTLETTQVCRSCAGEDGGTGSWFSFQGEYSCFLTPPPQRPGLWSSSRPTCAVDRGLSDPSWSGLCQRFSDKPLSSNGHMHLRSWKVTQVKSVPSTVV